MLLTEELFDKSHDEVIGLLKEQVSQVDNEKDKLILLSLIEWHKYIHIVNKSYQPDFELLQKALLKAFSAHIASLATKS